MMDEQDLGASASGPGDLMCQSCPSEYPMPARYIANAYGSRHEEGSSWDWPLCEGHKPFAMCAGWFPVRKLGEGPPYDPVAYLKGNPVRPAQPPQEQS